MQKSKESIVSETLALTIDLINRPSVTPDDCGCQNMIAKRLAAVGFKIEHLRFGDTDNLFARLGKGEPLMVLLGHTDVVPTGPLEQWQTPPFEATIRDGFLHGRGAADMKSGVAAMVTALERFAASVHGEIDGSVALLLTSDEEATGVNGVVKVIENFKERGIKITWCLVGEPSSVNQVGDTVKNGRRGSLAGKLVVHGIQGHVAYPQRAANPIHLASPAIAELCAQTWDQGSEFFDPTSFQISNIHAGTGADNVIPGTLEIVFNFRFSTALTPDDLKARVQVILDKHGLKYDLTWRLSGQPFLTSGGELVDAVRIAIKDVTGTETRLSTEGGTSDGRFVAPTGAQVVEVGLVNATIHKIDESVKAAEIDILSTIYQRILERLFGR
jgi:succinyl-diaminopimelate desuccinylase